MTVELRVYETDNGAFQVSIEELDESGAGHGYRLYGPKFSTDAELRCRLRCRIPIDAYTASRISHYLRLAGSEAP